MLLPNHYRDPICPVRKVKSGSLTPEDYAIAIATFERSHDEYFAAAEWGQGAYS